MGVPDPTAVAIGLEGHGIYWVCGALVAAVVAEFLLLWRVFAGRLSDRDTHLRAVSAANDEAKALIREVLPVLSRAAVALEQPRQKPRAPRGSTPPYGTKVGP